MQLTIKTLDSGLYTVTELPQVTSFTVAALTRFIRRLRSGVECATQQGELQQRLARGQTVILEGYEDYAKFAPSHRTAYRSRSLEEPSFPKRGLAYRLARLQGSTKLALFKMSDKATAKALAPHLHAVNTVLEELFLLTTEPENG
jgi:hypothetical protein